VVVAHGSLARQRFLALYRRGEYLCAAVGFNQTKLVTRYRRELAHPVRWDHALAGLSTSAAGSRPRMTTNVKD
jgi:hypothetical protein